MAFWTENIAGGSGGGLAVLSLISGAVNGTNTSFTFSSSPKMVVADQGRSMQKISSNGEVNWTGTSSPSFTVAPTFDVFAIG